MSGLPLENVDYEGENVGLRTTARRFDETVAGPTYFCRFFNDLSNGQWLTGQTLTGWPGDDNRRRLWQFYGCVVDVSAIRVAPPQCA